MDLRIFERIFVDFCGFLANCTRSFEVIHPSDGHVYNQWRSVISFFWGWGGGGVKASLPTETTIAVSLPTYIAGLSISGWG